MYNDLPSLTASIDPKVWKFWALYYNGKCILPYGAVHHGANEAVLGYLASSHTPKGTYQVRCKIRLSAAAENVAIYEKTEGAEATLQPVSTPNEIAMQPDTLALMMKAASLEAENKYLLMANAEMKDRIEKLEAQLDDTDTGLSDGPSLADRLEQLAPVLTPVLTTLSDLASRYFNASLAEKETRLAMLQAQAMQKPALSEPVPAPSETTAGRPNRVTLKRRTYEPDQPGPELANNHSNG